jgi:putative phosphoesterase
MKIAVLSDTHKITKYMDMAIEYCRDCDLVIHAGDNFSVSKYIHKVTKVGVIGVKGNCDLENVEDEILLELEGYNIFVCHGHNYNVKNGLTDLENKAKHIGADIVIFGHTHVPTNLTKDGILFLNPGSVSLPREVSYRSFLILNIEKDNIDIEEIKL